MLVSGVSAESPSLGSNYPVVLGRYGRPVAAEKLRGSVGLQRHRVAMFFKFIRSFTFS